MTDTDTLAIIAAILAAFVFWLVWTTPTEKKIDKEKNKSSNQ